jgi:hypothetical protein
MGHAHVCHGRKGCIGRRQLNFKSRTSSVRIWGVSLHAAGVPETHTGPGEWCGGNAVAGRLLPNLSEARVAAARPAIVAVLDRMAGGVILVIRLGGEEPARIFDGDGDWPTEVFLPMTP